jgi:hypothetical protein
MTITLAWWWIPVILVGLAVGALLSAKPTGDWDFITPIICTVIAIALVFCAALFMLGRWIGMN